MFTVKKRFLVLAAFLLSAIIYAHNEQPVEQKPVDTVEKPVQVPAVQSVFITKPMVMQDLQLYKLLLLLQENIRAMFREKVLAGDDDKEFQGKLTAVLRVSAETIKILEAVVAGFNQGLLYYNPAIKDSFIKTCNAIDTREPVMPHHLRELSSQLEALREMVDAYCVKRIGFLSKEDHAHANNISALCLLMTKELLSEEYFNIDLVDSVVDTAFCRPLDVALNFINDYKALLIGAGAIGLIALVYSWWKNYVPPVPPESAVVGFNNAGIISGNNCYINSSTQGLLKLNKFNHLIDTLNVDNQDEPSAKVLKEYKQLKCHLYPPITYPTAFQRAVRDQYFKGSILQQDASEFLQPFLDFVSETAKKSTDDPKIKEVSPIGIDITSRVTCNVGHISEKQEPMNPLGLAFADQKDVVPLQQCLQAFFAEEKLQEKNQYRCGQCRKNVDATRQFMLHACADTLIIQLKRFAVEFKEQKNEQGQTEKVPVSSKINTPVSIPLQLDLSAYNNTLPKDATLYNLKAIVAHAGSLRGGHYIAFIKDKENKWHCCDDRHVSDIDINAITTTGRYKERFTPYLLFYER